MTIKTKKQLQVYKYIENIPDIKKKPVYIDKSGLEGVTSSTVDMTVKDLLKDGILKKEGKEGVKILYRLVSELNISDLEVGEGAVHYSPHHKRKLSELPSPLNDIFIMAGEAYHHKDLTQFELEIKDRKD